ncbi:hypothetical protein H072_4242 [Dactylellina haptotyla CBS 200.50]|uniref:Uncharacterized protein n=1 Tax=Dactylellina haptotyla (strain CBS 200.50) TaxID=1284197 RepID=S8C2I9_DACHA|nr:hypothetical protein H072_4242 [Dactylellina haptotyla CBS 200.50]
MPKSKKPHPSKPEKKPAKKEYNSAQRVLQYAQNDVPLQLAVREVAVESLWLLLGYEEDPDRLWLKHFPRTAAQLRKRAKEISYYWTVDGELTDEERQAWNKTVGEAVPKTLSRWSRGYLETLAEMLEDRKVIPVWVKPESMGSVLGLGYGIMFPESGPGPIRPAQIVEYDARDYAKCGVTILRDREASFVTSIADDSAIGLADEDETEEEAEQTELLDECTMMNAG